MEFNENLPIYIQIMNYIKKEIITKKVREGEKLPSVRELSTNLTVNPNTMQRAYAELEREGLIFTQRGRGTFVTEDTEKIKHLKIEMAKHSVNTFIKEMQSLNFTKEEMLEIIEESIKEEEK